MEQLVDVPTGENRITGDFLKVRNRTEKICERLQIEDYVPQPADFVSPPKWHLAHTTWFYEQFILKSLFSGYKEFHKDFGYVFNSYYLSAGKRVNRLTRGDFSRPTVREIYSYRKHVNSNMQKLLENLQNHPQHEEILNLLQLGMNHEQQHQELLMTDIKYILGTNPLMPAYGKNSVESNFLPVSDENQVVQLKEGVYEIGFKGEGFSYDNESGRHKVFLEAFEADKNLITNLQFLEFIEDGGYKNFEHWLSEGWDFVNENSLQAPLYWFQEEDVWCHYTLNGPQELHPKEPVKHLSFFEADAFARWKGKRLLTEFEWEAINEKLNYGELWEWTSSAYLPYPRYKEPKGPTGEYNGKFMVNQKVLRGGSVATPEGHFRISYRNFWHTPYRWQYTGVRLGRTLD